MSEDITDDTLDGDEVVVGVHSSGIMLEEGLNTSNSRNYCSNCKRKIHCYVKVDKETHEAIVHITCKSPACECKCKTHFACKQCGYLHPYGQKCNRIEKEVKYSAKSDDAINKIMDDYRKFHENKSQKIPNKKENANES